MNPIPNLSFWLQTLGLLAVQTAVVVGLAAGVQIWLKSAAARRAAWQGALLGVALLAINAFTGADRVLASWARLEPAARPIAVVRGNLSPTLDTASDNAEFPVVRSVRAAATEATAPPTAFWWPAWLWLAGALVVGGRALGSRLLLAWLTRRGGMNCDPETSERIATLAGGLGFRRSVRLIESPVLVGPIAFGWWRPTIGLPQGFFARHSRAEQDTMLAHELAHLAARDPVWLALADALSAALWWHPAVWWLRRQFRVASETAADDASLLVQDGPVILADCLVNLAAQLQTRRATGWLGIAEFRSGLGRRVERLLRLRPEEAKALGQKARWVAPALVAFVLLGLAAAAWAFPSSRSEGPTLFALVQEAVGPKTSPGTTPSSARGSTTTQSNRMAAVLVQDARLFYEMGKLDEAEARLKRATQLDPDSTPARYYLELVQARRSSAGVRNNLPTTPAASSQTKLEADQEWLPPTKKPVTPRAQAATNNDAGGQLFTRIFKVDPHQVVETLAGESAGTKTNSREVLEAMEKQFAAAGWNRATNETFFFKESSGLLFVRAALTNLDVVESVIQVLNSVPPQVLVQVKFIEISQSDEKALGFDWYLGQVTGTPTNPAISGVTSGIRGKAPGVFPGSGRTGGSSPRELRGDELDWVGRGATNAGSIRVNATLGSQMTGILTDPQYRVVLKALEQRSGTDVLSAPSVTTLSGRQAQIQVVDMKTVVTGTDPVAGTNAVTTAVIPCGPVLDVVPTVLADGVTVQVNVKASVTEFLGYDPAARGSASGPQPLFRLRELKTIANVWDGQTLILGGGMVELPGAGTNAATAGKVVRKQLLVFVTPTIVDPAGNRVHTHDEMPFSTNAVPFQPKPGK